MNRFKIGGARSSTVFFIIIIYTHITLLFTKIITYQKKKRSAALKPNSNFHSNCLYHLGPYHYPDFLPSAAVVPLNYNTRLNTCLPSITPTHPSPTGTLRRGGGRVRGSCEGGNWGDKAAELGLAIVLREDLT